jgi:hypothetical protein
MDEQKNRPTTEEGPTVELWAELPEGVAGWVTDAAARFHVSRSEIIRRAVEHFLGHVEEVKVLIERREREPDSKIDWGHAKKTLEHAQCPYENCPFSGDCPVDVCPLKHSSERMGYVVAAEKRTRDTTNTDRPRWGEVLAVAATGVLHLVCKPLGLQGFYIVAAVSFWLGVVVLTGRRRPAVLREWGFRWDNAGPAFRASAAVFLPLMLLMFVIARIRGDLVVSTSLAIMLLLYPAWGLVQQFLVQALLVANLAKGPLRNHRILLIAAGGALFSVVHLGHGLLVFATVLGGAVSVYLYLKFRNLWPLGLFHGWLATLFYLWFLHRDKLTEIYGRMSSVW